MKKSRTERWGAARFAARNSSYYRRIIAGLSVSTLIFFGALVGCMLLVTTPVPVEEEGIPVPYRIAMLALLIVLALSTWAISYFEGKRLAFRSCVQSTYDYFEKPTYIYDVRTFLKKVERKGHFRVGRAHGVMVVIQIKDINGAILDVYGPSQVHKINQVVYEAVASHFGNAYGVLYGYSAIKGFMIYRAENQTAPFFQEVQAVALNAMERAKAAGVIPSIVLLSGACVPLRDDGVEECLDHAVEAALYNRASRLSSAVVTYREDQQGTDAGEQLLYREIREGIANREFKMFYQPKFSLRESRFEGAEALVRWYHPSRGELPPSFFIPFAERSGMIVDLDHYIFDEVVRQVAQWGREGARPLVVSVNLSRKTIYDPGLIEFLDETIKKYRADRSLIEVEITESTAARDSAFLLYIIKKIKELGMRCSIDDFGVGYSSFNSLQRLPFDTLKIDKSFIDDIELSEKSGNVVHAIIDISHALGMSTVAEGVETSKQVEILRKMGLDVIQGYYYHAPMPPKAFANFLANNPFEKNGSRPSGQRREA